MEKRIVIKVGSNVLTRKDGKLDVTRMSAIVDQIAELRGKGYEVILVSSGAVACGKGELRVDNPLDSVEQRQLYSALGQVKLIGLYYDLFREHHIHVGQVLTMKENFEPGEQYDNQRACMNVMLENVVLPIVNENDTVSVAELMFTDNDELSGLIAQMMQAEELILLTNVDGIYNGDPNDPHSRVIPSVYWNRDISDYISGKHDKYMAPIAALIMNPLSGIMMDRIGVRPVICIGSVLLLAGTIPMMWLAQMDDLALIMLLQGIRTFGISSLIQPIGTWSVRSLHGRLIPDGTSISNTLRNVAAAFGTSIMVLLMSIGGPIGGVSAFGVDAAIAFSAVCSAILLVLSFSFVRK